MRTISFSTSHNEIAVNLREWEGIGRPDYSTLDTLSIVAAESLLEKLTQCIKEAKQNAATMQEKRIVELKKEIEQKQQELQALTREQITSIAPGVQFIEPPMGGPTGTPPTGGSSGSKT